MSISAVLPIRAGSQRVIRKNTKPFAGAAGGLTEVKIRQLLGVSQITEVLVDTDDPEVPTILQGLGLSSAEQARIRVEPRDPWFARNETSTDELIGYLASKVTGKVMLWTHVTSPLVTAEIYSDMLRAYSERVPASHDSLMAVTPIQEFIWTQDGAVNYDYEKVRWPRTQDLPLWYFINSAAFIYETELARKRRNRVGQQPYLYAMDKITGWDVDWPVDFRIAEVLFAERCAIRS